MIPPPLRVQRIGELLHRAQRFEFVGANHRVALPFHFRHQHVADEAFAVRDKAAIHVIVVGQIAALFDAENPAERIGQRLHGFTIGNKIPLFRGPHVQKMDVGSFARNADND